MEPFFFVLAVLLVLFVGWLVAEFRAGPTLRIALGLACVLGLTSSCVFVTDRKHQQEVFRHHEILCEIGRLLDSEKEAKVRQALKSYEDDYETEKGDLPAYWLKLRLQRLQRSGD